jgi:hypothetical protein
VNEILLALSLIEWHASVLFQVEHCQVDLDAFDKSYKKLYYIKFC